MSTYWNGEAFVPYPMVIEQMAKAFWEGMDSVRDGHLRAAEPWSIARKEPRHGIYEGAIAAYRVIDPSFELPKHDAKPAALPVCSHGLAYGCCPICK